MIATAEYPCNELRALLPHPAPDANKYTRGKLIFIGGCERYAGAACLACAAAAAMGAGYVEACCSSDAGAALHVRMPSVVAYPWDGIDVRDLTAASAHPRACLIGSGMDAADRFQMDLVQDVLEYGEVPLVLDGGALSHVASAEGRAALLKRSRQGRVAVLTPHAGEAARLARACSIDPPTQGAEDHVLASFARDLACAYGATVLLKGPVSFAAAPPSQAQPSNCAVYAMRKGTPTLAKAGTGDVLAGMIAGLLAQRLDPLDACILAATVHAYAGRAAAEELGDISVCAEDVLTAIPYALRVL